MRVAITGTIGSGKSTFSSFINKHGYEVFSADSYNSSLLEKGSLVFSEIINKFDCANKDGNIDKQKLANIIFNNKNKKDEIEKIIHPLIIAKMLEESQNKEIFFTEIPILFEANLQEYFDLIILVKTNLDLAITRLIKRGLNKEDIINRINNQLSVEIKEKLSDIIVYNNGNLDDLELEAIRVIKYIEEKNNEIK